MNSKTKIKKIKAREILESRGRPTVEVDLTTGLGVFRAAVPSGASTGTYEAVELRDGGKRYWGKGVLKAVENVDKIIAPALIGRDPTKQKEIDGLMIGLDDTKNKSKLGANAMLAVSMAVCRAGAAAEKIPLYKYVAKISETKKIVLPTPAALVLEGGLHAGNNLDIQEFMIAPITEDYREKLRQIAEIYHVLEGIIVEKYGEGAKNVGYEGGFAVPLKKTENALDLIMEAVSKSGYENKTKIALDIAASSFFKKGIYEFEGSKLSGEELMGFYVRLFNKYPFVSIEDPFSEEDWQWFKEFTNKFGKEITVIGDDLLVTNLERIKKAAAEKSCNGLLLKLNQIGTVSETIEAAKYAMQNDWKVMVSHRGGETCDTFCADLCVGLGTGWIKAGAPARGERVAKYNRLLEIEEELKNK